MKKVLLSALMCLTTFICCTAQTVTMTPNPNPPLEDFPKDRRGPVYIPEIFAELSSGSIFIDATVFASEWITVTIYDEDDNIVLSGAYSSSTVFGINLSSLSTGAYTIKLEIDGYSYYYEGEFEL